MILENSSKIKSFFSSNFFIDRLSYIPYLEFANVNENLHLKLEMEKLKKQHLAAKETLS
jgi:hypothetical protein